MGANTLSLVTAVDAIAKCALDEVVVSAGDVAVEASTDDDAVVASVDAARSAASADAARSAASVDDSLLVVRVVVDLVAIEDGDLAARCGNFAAWHDACWCGVRSGVEVAAN